MIRFPKITILAKATVAELGAPLHGQIRPFKQRVRGRYSFERCIEYGLSNAQPGKDAVGFEKIKQAILCTQTTPSTAFLEWSRKIEARRSELLASSEVLDVLNLTAGSPVATGEQVTVGRRTKASKDPNWDRLLYELCAALKPSSVLEMGTCVGISASYLSAALTTGRILTLEGDAATAAIARETFRSTGVKSVECTIGPFQSTLRDAASSMQPIDLVFVDGHHEGAATIEYFELLLPFVTSGGVVVFDDVSLYDHMQRAWQKIKMNSRIGAVFDLEKIGIVTIT